MKRILVVAAHPDDDILGCGATMSKLTRMNRSVKVVFIGEGTSCRYSVDQISSAKVKERIEQRNDYGRAALKVLGVDDFDFHDLPCGRLDQAPLIDIGKIIESHIIDFKPDTILTHSDHDVNNDHRICCQATIQATRPGSSNKVSKVLSYEVLSSSEWRFSRVFTPNVFVALERIDLEKKIQALEEYKTEIRKFPFPRSRKGLETLAQYRGMQSGCDFAEAFYLVRGIV